ncbi:MAG: YciI family protein [Alicyclobacillus sp.]|nr:YciI family protein [Alicyclobacillus sp.]
MKYLALLTIVDAEKNRAVRPAHLQYVSDLYKQGKVFAAGPCVDGKGGLVIYECDSDEEGIRLANEDPIVTSGARTVEVRAWQTLDLPLPEEG